MSAVAMWMIAAASLLASSGEASARTALVAAGRCEDPELLSWSGQLAARLGELMGPQWLTADELMTRLPRWPSRSVTELGRQLEGATREYFQADYAAADRRALDALAEVDHLQPGPRRWQLYVRGLLLRALILRARNRSGEAAEQIRRILSVDPNHRLDSDYFPPSMRAAFDRLRHELLSQPRAPLAVTSTPPGAEIFIDGLDVRRATPATLALVPGRYTIAVSKDGLSSFPRTVDLASASSLQVDLDFESSVRPGPVPCIEEQGDERVRAANAVKLGRWLGVDQVVLFGAARRLTGDIWLTASLFQVQSGQRIRHGETTVGSANQSSSALAELADAISREPDFATASPPALHRVGEAGLRPVAALSPPEQVRAEATRTASPKAWTKAFGLSLVGAGALAAGSGVFFHLRADKSWANLARHYADGTPPSIAEVGAVQSIRKQADWQRRAAVAGYALGAAAVCTGVWLILSSSGQPGTASKIVRASLSTLSIEGSW